MYSHRQKSLKFQKKHRGYGLKLKCTVVLGEKNTSHWIVLPGSQMLNFIEYRKRFEGHGGRSKSRGHDQDFVEGRVAEDSARVHVPWSVTE